MLSPVPGLKARHDVALCSASVSRPMWPTRGWWAVLLAILVVGAALRYTGYNYSLPYVDHPDEPNFNIAGRMIIDAGSPKPLGMQGYPPGIIAVNYVFLRLFHDPSTPPSSILWMVRLLSISFNLGTLVVIGLIGYRVGTPLAGLLAAALWAVTTILVEFSRYATADNFVTFFTLLAFFLALTGTCYDRDRWTTWSVVALMLAIVFKYQAVTTLPLILLMPLWRLRGAKPDDRRRVLRNLGANVGWLAVFFAWLLLLFPATEVSQVPNWVAPQARLGIPSPALLLDNFRHVFEPMGSLTLWIPAAVGVVGLFLIPRPPESGWRFGVLMVVLGGLAWHIGVSFYGDQEFRQFVAEAAFFTILCGAGLGVWAVILGRGIRRMMPRGEDRQHRLLGAGAVGLVVALVLLPQLNASIANAREHTLPDRRNDLARWMDITLVPAPYIADYENHKTLDGAWGGYSGRNSFQRVAMANVMDRPIEEWRAMGVVYAIENYERWRAMNDTPEGRDALEEMLLLKAYEPSGDYRGPDMVVLRLYPIQHETDIELGPIKLVGYDIDRTTVRPGDSITFTFYWQAEDPLDADYTVFNHLVPLTDDQVVAQIDGPPLPDERRPTTTWSDDEETLISRGFVMAIPEETPPGDYRLISGFYRPDTGERLHGTDGADSMTVTTITVRR